MDISHVINLSSLWWFVPLIVAFMSATVWALVEVSSGGKKALVSIALFLTLGIVAGISSWSTAYANRDDAAAVFASYGITMEGKEAYYLIYGAWKGIGVKEFVAEQDGESKIMKISVSKGILTVYEQDGLDYVKLQPAS